MPTIAITNESTVMTDAQIKPIVAALQLQVTRDFAPIWGVTARVRFFPKGKQPADAWWLACFDTSDQAGALGYHDTNPAGLPLGKAFVGTDLHYGAQPSVTLSHELLEMLGDPEINLTAQVGDTEFYAYEACDAVEADELGYKIGNVLVSDFVTPAWFGRSFAGPYSFRQNVSQPLQLAKGGYISVWTPHGGWAQKVAQDHAHSAQERPRVGSRRERRRTPRSQWIASTVLTPTTEDRP
jgi:hypothetical protein